MKVLLTGASGFVGKYLLSSTDLDFRCLIRKSNSINYPDPYFFSVLDGKTEFRDVFDDIDSVIHLAGLAHSNEHSKSDFDSVNTEGTLNLARQAALAGVKKFIFVSTIGVNGNSNRIPFTIEDPPNCHNYYSTSKLNAEVGLKEICDQTSMTFVIIRPTLIYGHNAPGSFGSLTKLITKVPFLPFGLTNNHRDFISVYNFADLLMKCLKCDRSNGHIFLASEGETVSTNEFTSAIAKSLGKKVYQLPVPVSLMRLAGKLLGKSAMVEQLVGNLQVDSSNLKKVLGWTPPYTMEESMALLKEQSKESK